MPLTFMTLCHASDEVLLSNGNYTKVISDTYKSMTSGRFPRLEECFGINFRCFLEINSMYFGTVPNKNNYEALAIYQRGETNIIAVSDFTSLQINISTSDCDAYYAWIIQQVAAEYDSTVDYCGIKGDVPAVWAALGINRSEFMSLLTSNNILDERSSSDV